MERRRRNIRTRRRRRRRKNLEAEGRSEVTRGWGRGLWEAVTTHSSFSYEEDKLRRELWCSIVNTESWSC